MHVMSHTLICISCIFVHVNDVSVEFMCMVQASIAKSSIWSKLLIVS